MYAGEYVREALKRGLALQAQTGVNPYKFGLIGSTDSHTALATADEDQFFGKHSGTEPSAARAMAPQNLGTRKGRFRLALSGQWLCRRVGQGQHPRCHLRCDDPARSLCQHRPAHDGAGVRRLGFHPR